MKIHILQHVAFEGPGHIARWAEEHGHTLTYTRFYQAFAVPFPEDFDLLVVLGGPMGVNDSERYPWLDEERLYLAQMIAKGKKVLGICLGAQQLAAALGARVYRGPQKEIGWFPVSGAGCFRFEGMAESHEEGLPAFHWHGDTFDLPEGAELLFSSTAYANQGFVWKNKVIGLQFHWEVTRTAVEQLIEHSGDELEAGKFVQQPAQLFATPEKFQAANKLMEKVLNYLEKL